MCTERSTWHPTLYRISTRCRRCVLVPTWHDVFLSLSCNHHHVRNFLWKVVRESGCLDIGHWRTIGCRQQLQFCNLSLIKVEGWTTYRAIPANGNHDFWPNQCVCKRTYIDKKETSVTSVQSPVHLERVHKFQKPKFSSSSKKPSSSSPFLRVPRD